MQITAERAFWLLEYYRAHSTVLGFGGRILGEFANSEATILYVWPEIQSIGVELVSEDRAERWERIVPMHRATFVLLQMGDPELDDLPDLPFHSVLIIAFPDGTTMFLGEKAPAPGVPETPSKGLV